MCIITKQRNTTVNTTFDIITSKDVIIPRVITIQCVVIQILITVIVRSQERILIQSNVPITRPRVDTSQYFVIRSIYLITSFEIRIERIGIITFPPGNECYNFSFTNREDVIVSCTHSRINVGVTIIMRSEERRVGK